VASWDQQKLMVAYSAVSYEPKGATKPALGSVKVEADTKVSVSERLVSFKEMRITESNFPTLPKEQTRELVAEIDKTIPDDERFIALDRVLASIDRSQIIPKEVPGVKADPPVIFSSQTPAVLVNIDGDPIWSPIKENDLKYAVNTNWDLFQHVPTSTFYLRKEGIFLKASDVKGPWGPAGKLPESFAKLPADDNWKEVKAALPGKNIDAKQAPRVFVSTMPAEMILIDGKPAYQQIVGTSLYWVSNTDSDVFRVGQTEPCITSWPDGGSAHPDSRDRGPSPPRPSLPISRRSRSSTRARACWPPCPAPPRPRTPCCSRRSPRPRA
jgi:hypothetical protein